MVEGAMATLGISSGKLAVKRAARQFHSWFERRKEQNEASGEYHVLRTATDLPR
jgi:hypothetical protein